MPMHAPSPQPELALDERADAEHDLEHAMEHDQEIDPWSTGAIVFSLGPNFEDAKLD
jgi:hypothetical protein